jgi:FkbM family methyltransferase
MVSMQSGREKRGPLSCIALRLGRALALPYVRHEIPGWGKVAHALLVTGDADDSGYLGAGPRWREVRGKWHGYSMRLNVADWSERQTWFLARYHELDSQLLMNACLRPGERAIDVGANIGMLSLHAASRVGPGGRVDAFEPNPACVDRIRSALEGNKISHVHVQQLALSDCPGTLTLRVLENHLGMATLAPLDPADSSRVTGSLNVPVEKGDAAIEPDARRITFVKIDVEGFEVNALRGLRETLSKYQPVVATEAIAEWLERAGASIEVLAELMVGLGYEGYGLRTVRRGLKHRLHLKPFVSPLVPPPGMVDLVWVPKTGDLRARLGL